MVPHVDYSAELARAYKRGHPIANPQPGIGSDGVALKPIEVGDVGYISHVHGNFIRIFNVHLEPGADGQPGWDDLPDDFEPLPKRQISLLHDKTPVFKSQSVSVRSISAGASGTPFMGGSVAFSASSERGAILATPDPIHCYDAQHILSYRNYAKAHIESWHEFAVQKLGIDLALEDIILVTGVDRTTSWATAVFTNARLDGKFGLEVQYANIGVQLAAQFSWKNTQGALVNSGPTNCYQPPHLATGTTAYAGTQVNPLNTTCDQSLFIRHIRAKRRRWLGLKIMANGEAEDMDRHDDSSEAGTGVAVDGGIAMTSYPERQGYTDCLEPVLDYILEHSNVNIAIAHDEDLHLLPSEPGIVGPVVHVEDGFGSLRGPPGASTEGARVHLYETYPSSHVPTITEELSDVGQDVSFPALLPTSDQQYMLHPSAQAPQGLLSSQTLFDEGTYAGQQQFPQSVQTPWGLANDSLSSSNLHPSPTESRSSSSSASEEHRLFPGYLSIPKTPSTIARGNPQYGSGFTMPSSPTSPTADVSGASPTGSKPRRGISGPSSPTDYNRSRERKKEYAKSFRDNEKQHFEELRRRLFPTDPNTRRAECLERAIKALDELEGYKTREVQRDAEIEELRVELARANRRAQELEQVVVQPSTGSAVTDVSQVYSSHYGWM